VCDLADRTIHTTDHSRSPRYPRRARRGTTTAPHDGVTARREEQLAVELMDAFAKRDARYLWTDAFAVCNDVALARALRDQARLGRAQELVARVHATLGREREDSGRRGWLSGDEAHPTRRGLRIGKKLPERLPAERVDPQLEWDRDGQYFHYLTRWMHALDILARELGDARLHRFAYELAIVAHDAFTHDGRMYWKMSIDLSRPLVASMGQHDPLDGLVTYAQLRETAGALAGPPEVAELAARIASFARMLDARDIVTDDPLGLGGLLIDACRLHQLATRSAFAGADTLRARVLDAAHEGLRAYAGSGDLDGGADERLAFRELGLAIGLDAVTRIPDQRERFTPFARVRARIVDFWKAPENRASALFLDHRDINEVMLATSLVPEGCLVLRPLTVR
jgi:hypothetical protein